MLRKFMYGFAALALVVALGIGYAWKAESAGEMDRPVKGSGTPGNIAKWIDSNELGNSVIVEDQNGQVAIGNAPSSVAKFLVYGSFGIPNAAIRGFNISDGRGVEGSSANGIGVNGFGKVGVNAISFSNSTADAAVRGISQFGTPYAGDFWGNVRVTGMLTKGGGSFRIDHPLDPKNKYLSHSFVESPDMMNIYNGNVTTDARGEAIIELPAYFDALNRDFRYQLTVVGAEFARAIIAEKIKDNRFKIKTDKPRVEVSWQVTGIRKDKFAEQNRIQVESEKPASERGTLQNP